MSADVRAVLERLGLPYEARRGELWALCPSPGHPSKNPHWSVNALSGRHSCFSCGYGGSLTDLVVLLLRLDQDEAGRKKARRWIESNAKLEPKRREAAGVVVRVEEGGRPALAVDRGVAFGPTDEWVGPARDYVRRRRAVEEWQVERWRIGYAVSGRLGGRIVIPIVDARGRLASYVARDFTDDPSKKRFLYPAAGQGIDNHAMWGEEHWGADLRRKTLVVTEAAIDGLAVERAVARLRRGDDVRVGALGGSGVSGQKAERIARFGSVVVLTDPDPAGDRAADEIRAAVARHAAVARARPPDEVDADRLARDCFPALCLLVGGGILAARWAAGQ